MHRYLFFLLTIVYMRRFSKFYTVLNGTPFILLRIHKRKIANARSFQFFHSTINITENLFLKLRK